MTVEVVPDVLLGHREVGLVDQPPELSLADGERLLGVNFVDQGNSAAGSEDSVKRLLPPFSETRSPSVVSVTLVFSGSALKMSSSLRPGTVMSPAAALTPRSGGDELHFEIRCR